MFKISRFSSFEVSRNFEIFKNIFNFFLDFQEIKKFGDFEENFKIFKKLSKF